MKRCSKCGIEKELTEYHYNNKNKDGFNNNCKICNQRYRGRDLKRICIKCGLEKFYFSFKSMGVICFDCKKKIIKPKKEITIVEKKIKSFEKICTKCNKTKHLSKFKNGCKICEDCKIKANTNTKFAQLFRIRLNKAIKRQNGKKAFKSIELLSCDLNVARNYIESQFENNMSWNSGIHIDHIIPCSIYDLTKESEQLKCFNYMNLRPCTPKENVIKSAKLDYTLIEKHNIWHLLPEHLQKERKL